MQQTGSMMWVIAWVVININQYRNTRGHNRVIPTLVV